MNSSLEGDFSYRKNAKNEAQILAILSNIQDLINNSKGECKIEWKDVKNEKNVQYKFNLPVDRTQMFEIERYLDDIDNLIKEERLPSTTSEMTETEHCSNIKQEIGEPSESSSELIESYSDSDDESWIPSEDTPTQKESEQGHCSNHLNDAVEVEKKMDDLQRAKEDKVRETSAENEESTSHRRKISCPLVGCKANVVHLPRHMRNVHHWTKEAASKVLLKYNIRKRLNKEPKKKDYRCRRKCPIGDCHSIVRRLPKHLQKVHKLQKASKEYKQAILNAPLAPNRKHVMIKWQEEQLKTKNWNVEQSPQHSEEQHEEEHEEGVDDGDNNLDDNFEFASENESEIDEDDDGDNDAFLDDGIDDPKLQTRSTLPPLIAEFQEWLASPDGTQKDEKTVAQHGSQLFIMLKAIDDSQNIQSLLDLKLIRQRFLDAYVKGKKYEAGTTQCYLMSLRHFYSFLLSDKPDSIHFNWLDVSAAREKVKMWSSSYKRQSSTRKWQKLEEDMMNRLTPSNIRKFEKSAAAREAIKIIGQYSDSTETTPVTQSGFTLVRDFMFTQIFIDNANRPGVLAHMTMKEYANIQKHDDHYIITVKKHKTAHVHGPARIVLSERLKSWLSVFVGVMRSHVTTRMDGPVFLSWNGNAMKSGHITKAVQSVFKKAGLDVKVTSTSFRKAAVTKVHIDKPEMSSKLAGLMAHNEATAKKYYLLSEKSKTSVEVSKNLGQLMRTDIADACMAGEPSSATKETDTVGKKRKYAESEPGKSCDSQRSKRVPWTDDEVAKIKDIFKDDIAKDNVTLDVVRSGVETHIELCGMSPRRIYDKLKKDSKKDRNAFVPVGEPPQEHDSLQDKLDRMGSVGNSTEETGVNDDQLSTSIIAPTERNSTFNCDEVDVIHQLFKDMICQTTTISRVEVEKRCSANRQGRNLLQKSTGLGLVNRIKYERRKYRLGIGPKRQ